ncbi:MAG: glycosyltransferase family 2 protein [Opitutales bacterium]|nr:glycosyltransferase family 2 protein [Opitutales bacterium]
MPISILILTLNEEINIESCIKSVSFSDDVVVLDSYSSDTTCEIAKRLGARVVQRKFDDFGNQRNYALDEIEFKHSWIFHLDADERFTKELQKECERVIEKDEKSAYFVPNRIIFLNKWIKRCTRYPYPQVRLIKRGEVRFAKAGHGQREDQVERGVGHIHVPYDHYNFSKGIADWIDKHNRYSTEEAALASKLEKRPLSECFSRESMRRKRALKAWFIRMPCRPLFKFCYLYFIRRGFMDGMPGFLYCRLQMMYESMITIKIKELTFPTKRP